MSPGVRGEWRDWVGETASSLPGLEGLSGLLAQCGKCGATASATERHDESGHPSDQIHDLTEEQPFDHLIATAERRWRVLQDRARRSGLGADVHEADRFLRALRRLQDANTKAQPVHAGCGGPLNLYRLAETKEPNP